MQSLLEERFKFRFHRETKEMGRHTDRTIVNNTGLTGDFDLTLEWSPDPNAENAGTSLFTAIQEQLGLRLTSEKGQAEVIVVDNIERASGN